MLVKLFVLTYKEGFMKNTLLFIIMLSILIACAPQEATITNTEISDVTTQPISPDVESNAAMEDSMTRPITPEIESVDEEIDYGQVLWDSLYECFLSFVAETDEPNTYISPNGTRIQIIEQYKYEGERLTEADKANGILWHGTKWIDLIYLNEKEGEWKEDKLYFNQYRLYEDGRITLYSVLSDSWKVFSCDAVGYIGGKILFED
jgi:hypothetical protein